MSYDFSYVMEDVLGSGLLSVLFSGIPSSLLGIAGYVLTAIGLYTIAQRRGLNRPWLAWIPIVNCWILGSLSDQYRYVVKGEIKSKRKVLLVLNILLKVLSGAMIGVVVAMVFSLVGGVIGMGSMDERQIFEAVMGPTVGILGLALPMAGIAIAFAVIRYMALYDVYRSVDPVNCVLFTVLSILFGVTEPFFLFFSRNKDLGMPPRRQAPVYEEPVYDASQMNFWDTESENKDYL